MKEHGFWFIGDRCNEKRKGFSDVGDNGFKCFSRFNWSVVIFRYSSVVVYNNKDGHWLLIQMVRYSGPDIQERRAFIQIFLARGRRRDMVSVRRRGSLILGGHGGWREIKGGK